ncbi:hypothetical protein [Prosthecobacter sp.]|uniref:hypothetical protein n=1 Tax=Prosthecobacter sp. TaxID=1965333 RepID=UPI0024876CFB|nr:hypothetical protein [Prosthecobacter sp.]MDI1312815.1 hypothetical protein [Prosthecobacter sp.]
MTTIVLPFVVIGAVFVFLNWSCLITSLATKKHHSMVPPLGGLLILIGLLFDPQWRLKAWVGLVVDPGFWAMIIGLPWIIFQLRRSSESRLELRLSGQSEQLEVQLRLFRPDYYEIKLTRIPVSNRLGWQSLCSLGTWIQHDGRIELVSHTNKPDMPSRAVLVRSLDSLEYSVTESTLILPGPNEAPELPPVSFHFKIE